MSKKVFLRRKILKSRIIYLHVKKFKKGQLQSAMNKTTVIFAAILLHVWKEADNSTKFLLTDWHMSKWKILETGMSALTAWESRAHITRWLSTEIPCTGTVCHNDEINPLRSFLLLGRLLNWFAKWFTIKLFPIPALEDWTTRTDSLNNNWTKIGDDRALQS